MLTTPYYNSTNFSANHNGKLILSNFPTVRLHNTSKYYVTAKHLITLNKIELGVAEVKAVHQFSFSRITNNLSLVDAGIVAPKFKGMLINMYSNKVVINDQTQFDHIIFSWIERDIKNQDELLRNWWMRTIEEHKQDQHTQSQLNFESC